MRPYDSSRTAHNHYHKKYDLCAGGRKFPLSVRRRQKRRARRAAMLECKELPPRSRK